MAGLSATGATTGHTTRISSTGLAAPCVAGVPIGTSREAGRMNPRRCLAAHRRFIAFSPFSPARWRGKSPSVWSPHGTHNTLLHLPVMGRGSTGSPSLWLAVPRSAARRGRSRSRGSRRNALVVPRRARQTRPGMPPVLPAHRRRATSAARRHSSSRGPTPRSSRKSSTPARGSSAAESYRFSPLLCTNTN